VGSNAKLPYPRPLPNLATPAHPTVVLLGARRHRRQQAQPQSQWGNFEVGV
jgi:hypothetical protein